MIFCVERLRPGVPRSARSVRPLRPRQPGAAVGRHPAEDFGERVGAETGTELPQAGVVHVGRGHGLLDQALHEGQHLSHVVGDDPRVGEQRLQAQHHLAHQVVLPLQIRGVADAHRLAVAEAAQVVEVDSRPGAARRRCHRAAAAGPARPRRAGSRRMPRPRPDGSAAAAPRPRTPNRAASSSGSPRSAPCPAPPGCWWSWPR